MAARRPATRRRSPHIRSHPFLLGRRLRNASIPAGAPIRPSAQAACRAHQRLGSPLSARRAPERLARSSSLPSATAALRRNTAAPRQPMRARPVPALELAAAQSQQRAASRRRGGLLGRAAARPLRRARRPAGWAGRLRCTRRSPRPSCPTSGRSARGIASRRCVRSLMQRVASIVRSPRSAPVGQTVDAARARPARGAQRRVGLQLQRDDDSRPRTPPSPALGDQAGVLADPAQARRGGERALGQRRGVAGGARARRAGQPSTRAAIAASSARMRRVVVGSTRRRPRRARARRRSRGGGVAYATATQITLRAPGSNGFGRARRRGVASSYAPRRQVAARDRLRACARASRVGRGARDPHRVAPPAARPRSPLA